MEEQLWTACSEGNVEEVIKLIQNEEIDINWQDAELLRTPFYRACGHSGNIEIVKLFLNDKRVDINKPQSKGATPFWIACQKGHIEIVELLLNDNRVDINEALNDGATPFFIACKNGHIEIVKILLNEKVDIKKALNDGVTPFYIACRKGHLEVVKLLLNDERTDINKARNSGQTPFYIACYQRYIEIVKILLNDERVDTNKALNDGATPFFIACWKGHIEIVKLLLNDNRININKSQSKGATPFYVVCGKGHIEIVKLLLNDERVDINKSMNDGATPFYIACWNGKVEIVKLLLNDKRVDINKAQNEDATPFYIACQQGYIEIAKLLLKDERVDINEARDDGQTPFLIACENGHTDIVKLLLNDKRIDMNKSTKCGSTPFYIACRKGHTAIVSAFRNEKNKLNLKEEVNKYNQNLQQNKDIINSIGNLRDLLFYFPGNITLEMKQSSIQNFVQASKNCQEGQKKAFFCIIESVSLNDEISRIFRDVGGMNVLANSLIQSRKDIQETLLIPMRNIVNHNQLFRECLGGNSEFLKSLTSCLNETEDVKLKLNFAGIMLSLAGYISNKEIVKRVFEDIIFPIIRNNKPSKVYLNNALDCLMESSAIDSSKSILLEFGTKEIIQPFIDDQDSDYHFISCIIQAFLSSNDVNQSNEFGSNPTSPNVISKILNAFQTFINTEIQEYSYTEGYLINCYHVLKALGSLARNEANMKELKNNGIVKRIIQFITNRKDNLLKTSERTIEELSTLIWILSFDQDCKNEFLSNGVVEILKGFDVKDNERAKRAVDGALFILIGNQNENQNQNRNERKGQVLISYYRTQKEQAKRVANYLQSKNIPIWIDIEKMEGSVLDKMAEAVEESSVILIFLSSKYKDSQACRTEAEYAYKLKKEIIYIMAEENYQPKGWLGAILGNRSWYNPWKNMIFIEQLFLPTLSHLAKILNQPEIEIKATQVMKDSQSTNNDQNQNQQILNILEKNFNKMDEFEKRLQKMETVKLQLDQIEIQNKENYEKLEIQFKENLEKLEQRFQNLETQNQENLGALGKIVQKLETQNIENIENFEKVVQRQTKQIIFVTVTVICVCLFLRAN